jgi:hypothetical protein
MRNLILAGNVGRDTTIATLLSHLVMPPASIDPSVRKKPCYL